MIHCLLPSALQLAMASVAWAAPRIATRLSSPHQASSQDIELVEPTLRIPRGEHGQSPLRILPLGASITYGQGSSDRNGYRKHLEQMLQHSGTVVDMVGTVSAGKMKDNVGLLILICIIVVS